MTEFKFLTIESLHKLYKQGNVSFPEIINLQIDHIKQVENKIYSLVNFNSEEYLKSVSYTHLTLPTTMLV